MSEKNGAGKTHCQAAGEDEKQHRLTLQYQTYERLNDGPLPVEECFADCPEYTAVAEARRPHLHSLCQTALVRRANRWRYVVQWLCWHASVASAELRDLTLMGNPEAVEAGLVSR